MKNDIQVQRDVVTALDEEESVIAGSIGVEVHHGVVKLAGRVGDPSILETSESAARHVDGVTNVVMDVDVGTGSAAPTAGKGVGKARPI